MQLMNDSLQGDTVSCVFSVGSKHVGLHSHKLQYESKIFNMLANRVF